MVKKSAALWRQIQARNFTDTRQLADFLQLTDYQRDQIFSDAKFVLNLPYRLAEKIQKSSLDDPILRQFLPSKKELEEAPGYQLDPVSEDEFKRGPKLLQKYAARALMVTTSACAMHCRYCFRRNFPYESEIKGYEAELQQIRDDHSLREVLLSGGDPLSLSDAVLGSLLRELDELPHLRRIRFHTRFPIGIPERIDDSFLGLLASMTKQLVFVIHCNHPRELDLDVLQALKRVQRLGIPVLNQAVLLRGVNDSVDTLAELFETLSDHGVIPYYLHQLDRVQGASHFEVSVEKGRSLMKELASRLPGYALPRYVQEIPGKTEKTAL